MRIRSLSTTTEYPFFLEQWKSVEVGLCPLKLREKHELDDASNISTMPATQATQMLHKIHDGMEVRTVAATVHRGTALMQEPIPSNSRRRSWLIISPGIA
jgi:hypothetical protein